MYESFFGFRERPFDLAPNPRFLILTTSHREALSNLGYAISSRKGITLLVGEAGTGKTTVIRTALARQSSQVHCVHLHNPALTRPEFVEMLSTRFDLSARARKSKAVMLLELEDLLRQRHARNEASVLIVDEAQSLPPDLLEEIRLLANIEVNDEGASAMSVIVAGQPELAERLNSHGLRQLKQRVSLRCELQPLTAAECAGYIAGRIQVAGGVGTQVFTREAVALIHERSGGIPRTISVLADNAMVTAFAAGERPVSVKTVRDVCRDFDLDHGLADSSGVALAVTTAPTAAPAAGVAPSAAVATAATTNVEVPAETSVALVPIAPAPTDQPIESSAARSELLTVAESVSLPTPSAEQATAAPKERTDKVGPASAVASAKPKRRFAAFLKQRTT